MVELIRELCKKNGTTVKALEEELQLGKATVRRCDDNSPSISKVALVAERFGVSLEYLLTGKETAPAREEPELSEDEAILLSAYRALPDDEKRSVLLLLRRAAAQAPEDTVKYTDSGDVEWELVDGLHQLVRVAVPAEAFVV